MSAQLTCSQCNFKNEAERVYCHNCGAKLDRTLLPGGEEKKQKRESPEQARKRIKRMTNPAGRGFFGEVKTLFFTLLWAAVAASIVLICRAPDGVPAVKNELPTRLIQSEMMDALEFPSPRAISFSEDDINLHFKQTLKPGEGQVPGIRFERAYVNLLPGVIHIGNVQSIWGYPLISGVDYQLAVVAGKFTPTVVGGNFGRLKVHPQLMRYADYTFQSLWTALKRERAQMDKLQSVAVLKGQITLVTKGSAAAK